MPNYLLVGIFAVLVIIFYSQLDNFLKTKGSRGSIEGIVLQKRVIKSKILVFKTEYFAITIETTKGKKHVLKGRNPFFSRHLKIFNLDLNQIEENQRYRFEYYTDKFNVLQIFAFKLLS